MSRETINGTLVTDEQIEAWGAEAEQGYSVEQLRKRGRRPAGNDPGSVVPVRMDSPLLAELGEWAEQHHMSRSEAIRHAVRQTLES